MPQIGGGRTDSSMTGVAHYRELLIILGIAGVAVPFLLRLGVSAVIRFLLIGLVLGPDMLGTQAGRLSFAVLLFQDLAVVPILLFVSVLGGDTKGPLIEDIAIALTEAAVAIAVIVFVGRYALRPLLRFVAQTRSADLFMATTLLIAVGTGVAANAAGLSMALGAFVAGLVLAETEYRRLIETIIEPFKGLLLGAFFLYIGLGLDLDQLLRDAAYVISVAI